MNNDTPGGQESRPSNPPAAPGADPISAPGAGAAPAQDEAAPAYPGADHDRRWRALVAPADHRNPTPASRYDLLVIGAGPGGLVTAIAAAGLGARVALVERHAMGGDCLNVGCVPSKALLEITARGERDFGRAFAWLREVRADIAAHDSVERYTAQGVDVFLGHARFIERDAVMVEDLTLRARRIVIATGARSALPPIPGLAECSPLTNESVFELVEQPRRLAVLGAGPIGCELAQVFARLGTEVHQFELADHVLPRELPTAAACVADALRAGGVHLHLGEAVSAIDEIDGSLVVSAGGVRAEVDRVLVAMGRRANVDDLNVEAAGVTLTEGGLIDVDAKLRTRNRAIYAIGDAASQAQFTHNADMQARAVVQNALIAPTKRIDQAVIPRCTYTAPEVAAVGRHAGELEHDGVPFDRYRVAFGELDRGRAEHDTVGFAEVYTERGRDRLYGATLVGHDAGEQIAPLVLMMTRGLGLGAAASLVLPYPTRSEYLKRLADAYNRTRLTPLVARLIRWRVRRT